MAGSGFASLSTVFLHSGSCSDGLLPSSSPNEGTCAPGAFLVKAAFVNKITFLPPLLVAERTNGQWCSQITWQDCVGNENGQALVLVIEETVLRQNCTISVKKFKLNQN